MRGWEETDHVAMLRHNELQQLALCTVLRSFIKLSQPTLGRFYPPSSRKNIVNSRSYPRIQIDWSRLQTVWLVRGVSRNLLACLSDAAQNDIALIEVRIM